MIEVQRGNGKFLWRQIARALEREVSASSLKPGRKLPTEAALAERFRVNRHTVRRALQALRDKGLLRIEQGRGIFVSDPVVDYPVGRRTVFSENLSGQRRTPGGTLLDCRIVEAGADVSEALQLPLGRRVLALTILREADGRPLAIASHVFPLPRLAGMEAAFAETGSISQSLTHCGVAGFRRIFTRLTTRLPGAEEAELLGLPRSRPLLVARSVNVDARNVPVDFGCTRYAGERVQIVFQP